MQEKRDMCWQMPMSIKNVFSQKNDIDDSMDV